MKIGMGSDAVFTMFGQNTRELEWLVRAGMTPAQALASATTVAATLLEPLDEIHDVIAGVKWVTKDGNVVVAHPPFRIP